jgi:hypothetical protein
MLNSTLSFKHKVFLIMFPALMHTKKMGPQKENIVILLKLGYLFLFMHLCLLYSGMKPFLHPYILLISCLARSSKMIRRLIDF